MPKIGGPAQRGILIVIVIILAIAMIVAYTYDKIRLSGIKVESQFVNSVGMEMIKLTTGYWVSKFEVTQNQYKEIMGEDPSVFKGGTNPVENVSFQEAIQFCTKLTEKDKEKGVLPTGFVYNLPSFEQWIEFYADAPIENSVTPRGKKKQFLDHHMPVGSGEVNRLGIYDLRGNVREYSSDINPTYGTPYVLGAFYNEISEEFLRMENKCHITEKGDYKDEIIGFRCVLMKAER